MPFLTKHSVLIPTRYVFRRKHSTSNALISTVTNAFNNINQNRFTALLLLDLKKPLILLIVIYCFVNYIVKVCMGQQMIFLFFDILE